VLPFPPFTAKAMADDTITDATNDGALDVNDDLDDKEIAEMKERVAQMEAEAAKLRELHEQAAKEQSPSIGGDDAMETEDERLATDERSVHVANVDYGASPEEIQGHFQACGTINRVTILCDKFTGHPKGYAYVEFADPSFIETALALSGSTLRGRQITVTQKRTNIPGYNKRGRGGFRGSYRGGRGSRAGYSPYRARGRGRGRGYGY